MLGSRPRSLTFLAFALLGAACSASASNFDIGTDDGGASDSGSTHDGSSKSDGGSKDATAGDAAHTDSGGGDSGTGLTFHGTLVDFQNAAAIANGTVSGSGHTALSNVNGVFDLTVAANTAFTATATATAYTKLIGQELSISAYDDFGFLPMISTSTSSLLQGVLSGYDPSKGVIIVLAVATGGCASEGGATLSVSPSGTVKYFSGGSPSTNTSITAGETPSAVIYNVPPGVALTLSVASPSCTQAPYPFTQGVLTYTGAMKVEAGNAVTAARVFLQ